MLARILQALSEKPVSARLDEIMTLLNREVIPVLRAARASINAASSDTEFWVSPQRLRPTGGTTGSFVAVGEVADVYPTIRFDPSEFPETMSGRTREVYFRLTGMVGAPGAATAEFQLYNSSDSAVIGTALTTSSADAVTDDYGPIDVGSGAGELPDEAKSYTVRARRVGGTTEEALLLAAAFVVRYV